MRKFLLFAFGTLLLMAAAACKKTMDDVTKPGVSLPAVTDLTLQQTDANNVKISWKIPGNIPAEIQQPLNVYIEVNQVLTVMKTVNVSTVTLPDAPLEYTFKLPDPAKTYHFTVKLNGQTQKTDKNYSGNIYSLGQTVTYQK